jgi:predicted component of type VI protein secretion system
VCHQTQYVLSVSLVSLVLVDLLPLLPVLLGVSVQGTLPYPALAALERIALLEQVQKILVRLDPFAAVLALFQSVLLGPTALFDPLHNFHALWASSVQGIHQLPLSACWATVVEILHPRSCAALPVTAQRLR